MPLSGAERQKRYMERLKQENPLKYEEKRKAHLEKVKQRQKKIANLSEEEKRIKRLKWREENKKKKLNKVEKIQKEKEEKIKQRKEYRIALQNNMLKNENIQLTTKVNILTTRIVCLKKKLYRFKKKIQHLEDQLNSKHSPLYFNEQIVSAQDKATTPISKTNYFVNSLNPTIPNDDRNKIKRKIFELNVLSDSLKSEYSKTKNNEIKRKLKGIADNEITEKYKMKTDLSQKLGLQGRVRILKQSRKSLTKNINNKDIEDFFLRDDVSRSTAGKKETKTLKKQKMQKRYLNDTLDNLYTKKYIPEGGKASRTTFGRHKPFYVLTPNANDRNTCLCIKHTNLKMKAEKLKILNVIKSTSYSELIDEVTCDRNSKICMYSECESCKEKIPVMNTDINNKKVTFWYKWVLKSHEYSKRQPGSSMSTEKVITKKYAKDLISGSIETLQKEFIKELHTFKKHYYNVGIQESAFKMCREMIKEDEIVIICDFSENYTCKMSEEIQAAHFGASKNQFTLQTGVIYTKAYKPTSFCTISASNCHDPGAIWAHLKPVIEFAKTICPIARVLHMFSDGPTTQYRQKKNFYLFHKIICEDIFDYATWSYFEASHGKGPADGVGGGIKRKLDRLVAYGHDIPSAEKAYDLLKSQESDINIFYIPEESITRMQGTIPEGLIALPGTIQVHQIITNNSEFLFYRDLSCFCGTDDRGLCQCFDLKKHRLIQDKKQKQKKCVKRRRKSSSTDTEIDSEVTYAETSECENEEGDIPELVLNRGHLISSPHLNEEQEQMTKNLKFNKKNEEDKKENEAKHNERIVENDIKKIREKVKDNGEDKEKIEEEKIEEKEIQKEGEKENKLEVRKEIKKEHNTTEEQEIEEKENQKEGEKENEKENILEKVYNKSSKYLPRIKILSEIQGNLIILNEKTGKFFLRQTPEVGKFILAKFYTKHSTKIYRYVCLITEVYENNKIVVQGLKSKKSKNIFRLIDNDISIIEIEDIIMYLPKPLKENNNFIFAKDIDISEA